MTKATLVAAISAAFTVAFAVNLAHADDAPKPDNEVSFNVAVTSDYRYRGISQSRLDPALQGGADYINNPTGIYAGTWLSTIKWIDDDGGSCSAEWDLYAGKRGDITKDVSYDVGVLSYVYPSNGLATNADTTEIYGQLSYGPAYVKYSDSVTNLFGVANSKNSGYLDVGVNIDLQEGYTLNLHGGHQTVANTSALSYSDWKIAVTKDFGFASLAVGVVGTNTSNYVGPAPNYQNLGKTALVVSLSKVF